MINGERESEKMCIKRNKKERVGGRYERDTRERERDCKKKGKLARKIE